ncbi:MAG: hypothetical protein IJ555_13690 [Ruminococcus sp.]|nr:hypothetical protein [Ruminococcus sp.]
MISIKDLEILITDDELLDMLIYAKCMRASDPSACGMPHASYDRSELHTVLQRLRDELVSRHKTFTSSTNFFKGSP